MKTLDLPQIAERSISEHAHLGVIEYDAIPTDARFQAGWQALWERQERPLPFSHPSWVSTWWSILGDGRELILLGVWRGDELVAVAPLYRERCTRAPATLRTVGHGTTNDYNDWLAPPDPESTCEAAQAIFGYIRERKGWLRLEIKGVLAESTIARALPLAREAGLLVKWRPGLPCPHVEIEESWDAYLAERPRTLRYHLRSRLKRLADELGAVEFRRASGSDALHMLNEVIDLHARSRAGQENDAIFSGHVAGERFYRALIPDLVKAGCVDITSLYAGGRLAAAVVGLQWGNQYGYYLPAYDPELRQYVPGKLLVGHLMERAYREDRQRFDFMLGTESYKDEWASGRHNTITILIAPATPAGRTVLTAERLGRNAKTHCKLLAAEPRIRAALRRLDFAR